MQPTLAIRPLTIAATAAVLGAILAHVLGIVGVMLAGLPLLVAALRRRRFDAWCLAIPAALASHQPAALAPRPPRAGPVRIEGRVLTRLVLDDLRGDARCTVGQGHDRVLCVFEGGTDLRPGDHVLARACLAQPGYSPTGRALSIATVPPGGVLAVRRSHSLAAGCESLRLAMRRALVAAVPGCEGRLLAQLVLGHGGEVDLEVAEAHRETGLSHLLAVSGAHISLLAAMLATLLRSRHRHTAHAGPLLAAVLLYGTITGLDPPVVRALVGFALLLLGQRLGRRLPIAAALAAPGLVTALLWPQDALSVSFALSYAAVAGLALAPQPPRLPTWRQRLWFATTASAWATLTTAPLTLHWFGQLAPWTILATPLLSPLVALMLALGLVQATGGALGADLPWLAAVLRTLAGAYLDSVSALATLPGTPVLAMSKPPLAALAAAALLGGLALYLWANRRAAAALCCSLITVYFVPWPSPQQPGLQLLAVGHGQCGLVRLRRGPTVVIDCGSLHSARRAADALVEALAPERRIDLLVLSHGDADHVQGVAPLLRRVQVGAAVLPRELAASAAAHALERAEVPIHWLGPEQSYRPWPELLLSRPACPPRAPSNDRGLFAWVDLGTCSALFPGDAGADAVRAHLRSPHLRAADVLVLPHHGRPHAASHELLEAVRPRLALVSGGDADRPCAQSALARRRGVGVLETEQVGTITLAAQIPPRVQTAQPPPLWSTATPR